MCCAEIKRFRPYTLEEGRFLVKLARKAVETYLSTGKIIDPPPNTPEKLLKDNYGVFTTIEKVYGPVKMTELRGCIGYPHGYRNVAYATIYSAIAAAVEDPRFPPMKLDELSEVIFEVSILSPMEEVKASPRDRPKHIKVGYHGIVIERGFYAGLLLPQVPVEYGWDEETFLSEGCVKASLLPDCWLDEETKVYRFQAQIFKEVEPNGEVIERDLLKELEEKRK